MGLVIYESPFSPNFIPCIKWGLSEHWHDLTFGSLDFRDGNGIFEPTFLSEYVTGSLNCLQQPECFHKKMYVHKYANINYQWAGSETA